jgi:acetolactate synthase-1/2/3 large subunit
MNGAESLVRTLLNGGVDVCFTNPGTSEMHFVAALDAVPGMKCALCLFEGGVTGAADGYYRMARKPASTLLHLGPGLANGLANLHNAKKAGSGIVNIVGEHASYHIELDAPLTADIEGIARPVSHWVRTSPSATTVAQDAAEAIAEASTAPGRIATLILPGDTAWNAADGAAEPIAAPRPPTVADAQIEAAAKALASGTGKRLLLLGAQALTEDNVLRAARIAAATGCDLLTEWSNARMERGAGRVAINRIPYVVERAVGVLEGYDTIVLAGAREPVAFFAYPDKPSILTPDGCTFVTLAGVGDNLDHALGGLVDATDAGAVAPALVSDLAPPPKPTGALGPETIAAVLGRTIPENAIVVDESVSTGRDFFRSTHGAPPHSWLNNLGGSIGFGLPVATGAAMACPDRKVIALEGDGSAMYTVQSLWTMARESLDVTVLIFSNRSYQILLGELTNVGVQNPGPRALDMFSLRQPDLDWVAMAKGMGVPGIAVEDCDALERAMQAGLAEPGPYLIEVVL